MVIIGSTQAPLRKNLILWNHLISCFDDIWDDPWFREFQIVWNITKVIIVRKHEIHEIKS